MWVIAHKDMKIFSTGVDKCFLHECLKNYRIGKGYNPREGWYVGEVNFLKGYILALVKWVGELHLLSGTNQIIETWNKQGN